jgi:hypothetical protein
MSPFKPNVDWSNVETAPDALELFETIAKQRKYTLQLTLKKYQSNKPVEFYAIALPHGPNSKPIKGEGLTPDAAIRDLWNKLN